MKKHNPEKIFERELSNVDRLVEWLGSGCDFWGRSDGRVFVGEDPTLFPFCKTTFDKLLKDAFAGLDYDCGDRPEYALGDCRKMAALLEKHAARFRRLEAEILREQCKPQP